MNAIAALNSANASGQDEVRANILVVDDRADKLLVFKTILEDLGQNVVTLQSGESALRWLLDNECAVMLLDVNMPGMDGFETAKLIRGRRRSAHTPIIFITANPDEMHTTKGYSLGAVDYLPSPAAPNVLRSKVMVFVQLFELTRQIKRQAAEHVNFVREQAARTAAEESNLRASFLAEASKTLSSSLDISSLMVGATRLVVPTLADFSAITLIDGEGTLVRTACKHDMNLDEAHHFVMQDATWVSATNDVLTTGCTKTIVNFTTPTRSLTKAKQSIASEEPAILKLQYVLMLPLVARDKTHGVLALALTPSERSYDSVTTALATDIASRIAVALDNCLLFREVQRGDQRKNEFLATLSHELRNPLAPMRTAVHALHLSGQWPAGAHELREMFDRQLAHLTHLVDDLLDVARISQGKIRLRKVQSNLIADINNALDSARSTIQAAGHNLVVSLPDEPIEVEGDRVRLQQIFENLLLNASKYTDPAGRIEVCVTKDSNEACVTIRDTGVGISAEMMPKIWDIFSQADPGSERAKHGLGIGLSLVKNLVQLHGGSIEAHSAGLGKGSEFMVRLPIAMPQKSTAEVTPTGITAAISESGEQAHRILVVDDNIDAAESLQMLLGVFGHTVEIAHNGSAALQSAKAFKPELVFLDIGLPDMSGHEVARRIRSEPNMATVKLIALSGYGTESDQLRSKAAGFDRHLVKPVDPTILPHTIANVFQT